MFQNVAFRPTVYRTGVKVLLSNLYTVPFPVTPKLPLCTPPHWANGEIPVKIVVQSVLTKQKMCKMCTERKKISI